MLVQETFNAKPMTASGPILGASGGVLGGFLATASGTLKLTQGTDGSGATIVDTVVVTAGVFLPLPFAFTGPVYAALTNGAQGTFAVA